MPSLQEEVHATLRDVEKQTIDLFTAISASSSFTQTAPTSQVKPVRAQVRQLQDTHRQLSRLVDRAAEHQVNQARLIPLLAQIKERDTKQRDAILRISTLRTELKEMVEAGNKLWTQTTKAEKGTWSTSNVKIHYQLLWYSSMRSGSRAIHLRRQGTISRSCKQGLRTMRRVPNKQTTTLKRQELLPTMIRLSHPCRKRCHSLVTDLCGKVYFMLMQPVEEVCRPTQRQELLRTALHRTRTTWRRSPWRPSQRWIPLLWTTTMRSI